MKTHLSFYVGVAVLALTGCASAPSQEDADSSEGAATASAAPAATATKAAFEKEHPWTKIHASYPVIKGGDLSDAEAAATNDAVKAFAENLLVHPPIDGRCSPDTCDYYLDCFATLATRDLTAVACTAHEATRIHGTLPILGKFAHSAFHFIPRTGQPTDLRALFEGDLHGKVSKALRDEYDYVAKNDWKDPYSNPDAETTARMFDTAAVIPYGLLLQEGAIGDTGFGAANWRDLGDGIPNGSLVANLAAHAPPTPTGDAAWKWPR